jgi:hypothetical protein
VGRDPGGVAVLRAVHVTWPPESYLRSQNAALAAVYLTGAEPMLMAVGLGDLIRENLGSTSTRWPSTSALGPTAWRRGRWSTSPR